jgi:membrane-associated protease RseP (regulator of RpoE activity)
MMDSLQLLALLIGVWFTFYAMVKLLKVKNDNLEVSPMYALYKSTRLNGFIVKLANSSPGLWRIIGNVGIVAAVGEAIFGTWLLSNNLVKFILYPETAAPVVPLIPGVTISASSLPWFMLGAGVVILTHELSHGIQCVMEGVKVKSAALMVAVITFGGAVEPDEEDMNKASLQSKLRIFAGGSIINLITGLLLLPIIRVFGGAMPDALSLFVSWIYFISINLAIMNMLPIGPLDGGQIWRTITEKHSAGKLLQKGATYIFVALIIGNIILSFNLFGLVPI